MTAHGRPTLPFYTCDQCSKRSFLTRRQARQAARTQHNTRGGRLHPYPCPHGNDWHIGHMPNPIATGALDRHTYTAQVTPNPNRRQP